jgi:hypothetical protein
MRAARIISFVPDAGCGTTSANSARALLPHGVRPTLVVEKDGLRHAARKGLRPEKKPAVIRRSPVDECGPL